MKAYRIDVYHSTGTRIYRKRRFLKHYTVMEAIDKAKAGIEGIIEIIVREL